MRWRERRQSLHARNDRHGRVDRVMDGRLAGGQDRWIELGATQGLARRDAVRGERALEARMVEENIVDRLEDEKVLLLGLHHTGSILSELLDHLADGQS